MKKMLATFLLVLALPLATADEFIGTYTSYPPFVDANRPDNGIFAAILNEVLANHGDTAKYLEMPWTMALSTVQAHQYDFVAGMWYNEERLKDYVYSEPLLYNRLVFISRKSEPFEYNGLQSLNGKRIGVIREYKYTEDFINYDGYDREVMGSLLSLLKMVRFEGVDLTLEDEVVAREEMRLNAPELLDLLHFSSTPLSELGLIVGCARANPICQPFVDRINASLAEMTADGRLEALYDRLGI